MAIGDISLGPGSLQFQAGTATNPSVAFGPTDIAVIAYQDSDLDGQLCTCLFDSAGNIGASIIDTWEFDTTFAGLAKIQRISGNKYACMYYDQAFLIQIFTFTVLNNGTIIKSKIDTETLRQTPGGSNQTGYTNEFRLIAPNTFLFCIVPYSAIPHKIGKLTISDTGEIDDGPAPSLDFTLQGDAPNSAHVSGPVWVNAYKDTGGNIQVETHDFSSLIDIYEIDSSGAATGPAISQPQPNRFALAHQGPGNDGYLKTFTIDSDGTITKSVIQEIEHDTEGAYFHRILIIGDGVIAIPYMGYDEKGWIKTYPIAVDGTIGSLISSLEYESTRCYSARMLHKGGDIYGIVFSGTGEIVSLDIETPGVEFTQHLLMIGVG